MSWWNFMERVEGMSRRDERLQREDRRSAGERHGFIP